MAAKGQPKTGGRKKGTPNKASAQREAEIAASGLTPLEYLTSVYRNRKIDLDTRVDAAGKAAPYVHPKLASIIHKGDTKQPIMVVQVEGAQYEAIAKRLLSEI